MGKLFLIVIVAWVWSRIFRAIYGWMIVNIKRKHIESTVSLEEPYIEEKQPIKDKDLAKALKNYEKMCDRYQLNYAIYETKARYLDHNDNQANELIMGVEYVKLDHQLESIKNYRQAIIDTYGIDPGDEDGYKVSL